MPPPLVRDMDRTTLDASCASSAVSGIPFQKHWRFLQCGFSTLAFYEV